MQSAIAEKTGLREKLTSLFAKAKLPSSPALATRILSLADNPDTNTEEFASVIQMDAALSARLLKMANAAHLAQRTPVTTVSRAVKTLGISQVRTAALGFQLVGHLHKLGGVDFEMKSYWRQSALRACLGREFAKIIVPSLCEEAFLVGLLQDCGILLLVQLLGQKYASLYLDGELSPTAFYTSEQGFSEYTHVDAVSVMAAEWRLPEVIALPLSRHHKAMEITPASKPLDKLCAVSYLVGGLQLVSDVQPDASEPALHEYAVQKLGLDESKLNSCFAAAVDAYAQTKDLLGDTLPDDYDVSDLLSEANNRLTSAAEAAEVRVRTATVERETMSSALGEYRERAARDPLTSVLNRGALIETGTRLTGECRQRQTALSIFFLDIDNFKNLNDTYGHKAGDEVLVGVAMRLGEILVRGGCVGRYGGEEFVVVIPHLSQEECRKFADALVTQVRTTQFPELNLAGPVTCSLGAQWVNSKHLASMEEMFAAADKLMYVAKKSGKDQSRFDALGADQAPPSSASSAHTPPPDQRKTPAEASRKGSPSTSPRQVAHEKSTTADSALERLRKLALQLNRDTPRHFVTMRKQPRKDLLTGCVLCGFMGNEMKLFQEHAFVRNISTGGIGLLTTRSLMRGDPVEVTVPQGGGQLYVTGLVCYCRQIEGSIHDVGVQFTTHSREPIFSHDPVGAANHQSWLADALADMRKRAKA